MLSLTSIWRTMEIERDRNFQVWITLDQRIVHIHVFYDQRYLVKKGFGKKLHISNDAL